MSSRRRFATRRTFIAQAYSLRTALEDRSMRMKMAKAAADAAQSGNTIAALHWTKLHPQDREDTTYIARHTFPNGARLLVTKNHPHYAYKGVTAWDRTFSNENATAADVTEIMQELASGALEGENK